METLAKANVRPQKGKQSFFSDTTGFWLLILGVFGIYLTTVARYPAAFGDSEELITTAYLRGVAHPPGYPLSQLLLHVVTHLPIPGRVAFRANLLAAGYQVFTIGFVYLGSKKLLSYLYTRKQCSSAAPTIYLVCVVGTLSLAFSPLFWTYATVYEVFALNNLFTALLIYLWFKMVGDSNSCQKEFFWFCLVSGLALAHQQLIVLLVLPLSIGLGIKIYHQSLSWQLTFWRLVAGIIGTCVVFCLSYMPLFWFDAQNAPLSWQLEWSWSGIQHFILRQDFASISDSRNLLRAYVTALSLPNYLSVLHSYFNQSWYLFSIGFPLSLLGLGVSVRNLSRPFALPLIVATLLTTISLGGYLALPSEVLSLSDLSMLEGIRQRMFLMGYVVLSIWMAPALYWICDRIPILTYLKWGLLTIIPVSLWLQYYPSVNLRDYNLPSEYSHQVLSQVKREAVIGCFSDLSCFSLLYTQLVEATRLDVTIVPITRQLRYAYLHQTKSEVVPFWYDNNDLYLSSVLAWNLHQGRPVYVTQLPPNFLTQWGTTGTATFPLTQGLVTELGCNHDLMPVSFPNLVADVKRSQQPFQRAFILMLDEQKTTDFPQEKKNKCLSLQTWLQLHEQCSMADKICQYQALFNALWTNPTDVATRKKMVEWYRSTGVETAAEDEQNNVEFLEKIRSH